MATESPLVFRESGEPAFVALPRGLPPGSYTAVITGTVDGVPVEASQPFAVTGLPQ